ncbi:MAG TPA: hypothetical protein VHD63_05505 [Ktedonobacteraceae bacterium]|nr:hypothetical protein [Ktedonobacteraceae bacterium]
MHISTKTAKKNEKNNALYSRKYASVMDIRLGRRESYHACARIGINTKHDNFLAASQHLYLAHVLRVQLTKTCIPALTTAMVTTTTTTSHNHHSHNHRNHHSDRSHSGHSHNDAHNRHSGDSHHNHRSGLPGHRRTQGHQLLPGLRRSNQ